MKAKKDFVLSNPDKKKSLADRLFDALSSLALTIVLLIGLAASSILGTVLQQNEGPEAYVAAYGEKWAGIIQALRLDDMYHAWWFQALLAMLLVNITFCSLKRLPHTLKQMNDRDPVFDKRPVAIHERTASAVAASPEEAEKAAAQLLRVKTGKVLRAEAEGSVYLFASRGGWCRLGVYVTHFSLFLFAIGALVGSQWGFKGMVNIPEGKTAVTVFDSSRREMTPLGFAVRCDKFTLEYYPNGNTKDYVSELTVLEGGTEVLRKRIEVNDPLVYKGYYFYQSSFGEDRLRGVRASVMGPDRRLYYSNADIPPGTGLSLPDGSTLGVLDLSKEGGHSGLVMGIVRDGSVVSYGEAYPPDGCGTWWPVGDVQVRLDKMDWAYYTGLQVAKDPGVPVVWAGCFLVTLGLMMSFFLSHRRVWVKITPAGPNTAVVLAGNASRNRIAFERWFETMSKELETLLNKPSA